MIMNSSLRHFLFLASFSVWVDMIDFKNGKCWDLTNGQCGEQTPSNHFHSQDSIFDQKHSFSSKCEEENMNLNQWHDSCGVIDSFEGWLLLRIFKLPHHLSFILAVIIHSRKFTRRENSLICKHGTYTNFHANFYNREMTFLSVCKLPWPTTGRVHAC